MNKKNTLFFAFNGILVVYSIISIFSNIWLAFAQNADSKSQAVEIIAHSFTFDILIFLFSFFNLFMLRKSLNFNYGSVGLLICLCIGKIIINFHYYFYVYCHFYYYYIILYYRSGFTYHYEEATEILGPTHNIGSLYLGNYGVTFNKYFLQEKNIKTILTVAAGLNNTYDSSITHYVYPALDRRNYDITQYFDESYEAIEKGLQTGSVLVHCRVGASRSASIVIAYLMKKNGWSFDESYSFTKEKRYAVSPNSGFVKQLKNYEKNLNIKKINK